MALCLALGPALAGHPGAVAAEGTAAKGTAVAGGVIESAVIVPVPTGARAGDHPAPAPSSARQEGAASDASAMGTPGVVHRGLAGQAAPQADEHVHVEWVQEADGSWIQVLRSARAPAVVPGDPTAPRLGPITLPSRASGSASDALGLAQWGPPAPIANARPDDDSFPPVDVPEGLPPVAVPPLDGPPMDQLPGVAADRGLPVEGVGSPDGAAAGGDLPWTDGTEQLDGMPPMEIPPIATPLPDAAAGGGFAAPGTDGTGSDTGRSDSLSSRPRIVRIEFVGNRIYTGASVQTRMRNKVGRRLDPVALEADLGELRRFFSEIQVVDEPVPGGIVLRFLVSENPLVERLRIRGNDEIELAEIRALLRTREGFPLSPYHLAQDREDIIAAYRLRGFHFASVPEPRVVTLASGGKLVDLIVVEGPEVEVAKVLFRGRRTLAREKLLDVMQTGEPGWFEDIFSSVTYREALLREDMVAIKQLYRDEGFLDAEVALEDLRFSDNKKRVEITLAIDEGPAYVVGDISIKITRLDVGEAGYPTAADQAFFTEDKLREVFGVVPGARWSGEKGREGATAVREAYFTRSYHDVRVLGPKRRGRMQPGIVDVELEVVEGAKFRLARIDFVGNEYTRDRILRRDIDTAPGGYVDRNTLEDGLSVLRRTTYFDRSTLRLDNAVGPGGEPIPGWKTATYELVEGKTGSINFGFSLGTSGGLGAFINLTKRNFDIARLPTSLQDLTEGRAFTGAGQEFSIMIAPSTRETAFNVRFSEPRMFGSWLGFNAGIHRRLEFRESYQVDRLGYTLGLSYPILRDRARNQALTAQLGWRHEWLHVEDLGAFAVPGAFLFEGRHEIRALTAGLSFRTLDNSRDPQLTTKTGLSAETAGGFLGGDLDWWKLRASNEVSRVLSTNAAGGRHRLTFTGGFEYGEALEDTPELPPFERFYAGGRTFRGFGHRGVGPHVNGRPTGGEVAWRASLEYEFPIVAKSLSLVAFAEAGAVEADIDQLDWSDTRFTLGLGARIALPMLGNRPIAIDFGWAVKSKAEDEKQVLSFSLGRTF